MIKNSASLIPASKNKINFMIFKLNNARIIVLKGINKRIECVLHLIK